MTTPIPSIRYSFDSWTSGTTIMNEGSLGSSLDATLTMFNGGTASISSSTFATGTQSLNLIQDQSTGKLGYLTILPFTMGGTSWAVCFWVKIAAVPLSATVLYDFCTHRDLRLL